MITAIIQLTLGFIAFVSTSALLFLSGCETLLGMDAGILASQIIGRVLP